MLFVGDDWAEDHHDIEVQDESGRRLVRARLPEGIAGLARLHELTRRVVAHHLLGSPRGALAERFTAGEAALSGGDRTFAVVYLTLHGLLKLGLVVALLRELRPAYPVAIVVLMVFIGYEAYRAARRLRERPIDAICATTDEHAFGVLRAYLQVKTRHG